MHPAAAGSRSSVVDFLTFRQRFRVVFNAVVPPPAPINISKLWGPLDLAVSSDEGDGAISPPIRPRAASAMLPAWPLTKT